MNAGLVNILNISDGLLSDELCIKFICTFNAPLKDIDEALLRKGRLAARYEFKDLTTDKVNQLIKEESLDIPEQTHPMTLAEIYNYEGMGRILKIFSGIELPEKKQAIIIVEYKYINFIYIRTRFDIFIRLLYVKRVALLLSNSFKYKTS